MELDYQSAIEEYIGLEGGPPFSRKSDQNSNTPRFTGKDRGEVTLLMGENCSSSFAWSRRNPSDQLKWNWIINRPLRNT
ncbi:hypothetical protein F2Q69_00006962 [Brassica cretica]|uniref:Uncharacterized protein n=1 Tax=Brassica cretica TaxID=69181 RepID=A0A8S9NX77_BRACR|nr:hypothetical protein F2Q69_00006962 [Brassica cretica]